MLSDCGCGYNFTGGVVLSLHKKVCLTEYGHHIRCGSLGLGSRLPLRLRRGRSSTHAQRK